MLRVNLYWGGRVGVARSRPASATDPSDPAYDWSLYDRTVNYAAQHKIRVLFSIFGTPGWANGAQGLNVPPAKIADLNNFAYAAAKRYSGVFPGADGRTLPPVKLWLAWNEPNNPIGLKQQFKRVGGRWVIQSAIDYAKICTAVYSGVHATLIKGEKVACGVTAPRGNNDADVRAPDGLAARVHARAQEGGAAHVRRVRTPSVLRTQDRGPEDEAGRRGARPRSRSGNINVLIAELTRLWGPKRLWITEYGYQTNPPDRAFGVSYKQQAAYMKEAYAMARKNPRIDMMLWFLLRDEPGLGGWQSGLLTRTGAKKPSFNVFRLLPRG